jgi:hypothetical protein
MTKSRPTSQELTSVAHTLSIEELRDLSQRLTALLVATDPETQEVVKWLPGEWYLVGWRAPADLAPEIYYQIGAVLGITERARGWWWGDYILYGERRYGEMYAQAMDLSGLQYTTLAHYVNVCKRIDFCRRRQNLTFSHHAAVARDYLTTKQQDRLMLASERLFWSVKKLEEMCHAVRAVNEREQTKARMLDAGEMVDVMSGDNGAEPTIDLVWIESDESADDDYQADGGRFMWCPHCGARVDF